MKIIERLSVERASFLLRGKKLPRPGKKKTQLKIGKITFFILCSDDGNYYSGKKNG